MCMQTLDTVHHCDPFRRSALARLPTRRSPLTAGATPSATTWSAGASSPTSPVSTSARATATPPRRGRMARPGLSLRVPPRSRKAHRAAPGLSRAAPPSLQLGLQSQALRREPSMLPNRITRFRTRPYLSSSSPNNPEPVRSISPQVRAPPGEPRAHRAPPPAHPQPARGPRSSTERPARR